MPRLIAYPLLVVAGIVSLPVAATFLDDQGGTECDRRGRPGGRRGLPAQLGGMALIGALVGLVTPSLAGDGASTQRRVVIGGLLGLGAAVVGVLLFFLLLNGFDGA